MSSRKKILLYNMYMLGEKYNVTADGFECIKGHIMYKVSLLH